MDYLKQTKKKKNGKAPAYTPAELWDIFVEYVNHLKQNPIEVTELVPRGIKKGKETIHKIQMPKHRAMTVEGFTFFADISIKTFHNYGHKRNKSYIQVYTRIRQVIYTQKFEGAAAGIFNSSIIAKELGLVEKTENKHEVKTITGTNFIEK